MNWIITIIAITGVVLNARCKWYGFLFWLISNAWWCWHNYVIGEHAQSVLFGAFWLLSLYGIYRWRKSQRGHLTAKTKIEDTDFNHKARFMVVNFCTRILSIQKSLNRYPGRTKINWLLQDARMILKLLGYDNDQAVDNKNQ